MYFNERTIDRGLDYFETGRVLEKRMDGALAIGVVSGTREEPYTVVLDTDRPERSVCTCPVEYECKHLVALICALYADDRTDPEVLDSVEEIALDAGLLDYLEDALDQYGLVGEDGPEPAPLLHARGAGEPIELTIDLEAEIAAGSETTRGNDSASGSRETGGPRYVHSQDEAEWRAALIVNAGPYDRAQVSLARQYLRRDGTYGRIDGVHGDQALFVSSAAARDLLERIRVFGGSVPLVAIAAELLTTEVPLFSGNGSLLSGVQDHPIEVIRPERFDLEVTPVPVVVPGAHVGLALRLAMRVTAGEHSVAVPANESAVSEAALGTTVLCFTGSKGLILVSNSDSPLEALGPWFTRAPTIRPAEVAELRAIAERFGDLVSLRSPARIRVSETVARPVFTLRTHSKSLAALLELEVEDETDGYSGSDYVVHLSRPDPPEHAIDLASSLIGSRPFGQRTNWYGDEDPDGPWRWEQRIARGRPEIISVALGLTDAGYEVYIATREGRRLVRRGRQLAVRISSGIDWFAPVVYEGESVLNESQLRGLALRGALESGEEVVLFSNAEVERVKALLESAGGSAEMRVPRADVVSFSAIAELADEVAPDLEPVRSLADALLTGKKPRAPRKPAGLKAKLRPYQRTGFSWLVSLARHGLSGCLADDMGLGKTVQALALMQHLIEGMTSAKADGEEVPGEHDAGGADRPGGFLVIAPVSTLGNWMREAGRFTPGLSALVHHGAERIADPAVLASADLVITSYATAMRDAAAFGEIHWQLVVLDEAQAIKNPHARTTKMVKQLGSELRLCLTGTPVENLTTDLWSIMDFLVPGLLGSLQSFTRRFPKRRRTDSPGHADSLARLRRIVSPFLMRRTKEAVAPELPPKVETVLGCEMSAKQARFYETLRAYHQERVELAIASGDIREIGAAVFTGLLRLRQAAIHPPSADPRGARVPSVKADELIEQLEEIVQEGHKALVFSQFVSALTTFRDRAAERGIATLYLDGSTRDRETLIDSFQDSEEPCVFFVSLKAGGTGINLTAADYVYICDPWWNPQVERQAVDRAHRIGRERPVIVTRLVAEGTVERKVLELQDQKKALAADLIAENASGVDLHAAEELRALFSQA